MRKLSHEHVVRLVGQYILPSRELCLLIWPAAVCTLGDFLDDLEHFRLQQGDRDDILNRFQSLDLQDLRAVDPKPSGRSKPVSPFARCPLEFLRSVIGCTAKALAYCHETQVRHNDIKPSNVLLMPERVYLADFGISKDVSGMDHTTTEGQPGSEKWRAPELYSGGKKSMQLADMYSLGLVYLNIATVLYGGTIDEFDALLKYDPYLGRQEQLARREQRLKDYINRLSEMALADSLHRFKYAGQDTVGPKPLLDLIRRMTATTPKTRPEAQQVHDHLFLLGGVHQRYHGSCCRKTEEDVVQEWNKKLDGLTQENERQRRRIEELEGRDQTYERRLENERRKQEQHVSSLQRRLEEAEQRCRELVQESARRRSGHFHGHGKRNGPALPPNPAIPGPTQSQVRPTNMPHRPPLQVKAHSAQQTTSNGAQIDLPNTRRITPALRSVTEPVTQRSLIVMNGNGTDQRKSSPISRIPLPITPTRAGTPSSLRDPSSTDTSLASSVFSRKSVDTTPAPMNAVSTNGKTDSDATIRVRIPAPPVLRPVPTMQQSDSWTSTGTTPPTTPSAPSSPEMLSMDSATLGDLPKLRPKLERQTSKASKRLSWADVARKF